MATAAQEEFNDLVAKNSEGTDQRAHPEDRGHDSQDELDEEAVHRNTQVDAAMRMPTGATELQLPPVAFDSGRSTGVKGVIADARSYESARRSKFKTMARNARQSILGVAGLQRSSSPKETSKSGSETDDDARSADVDDDEFLQQWRESRRRELENEAARAVRTRRTSPSSRIYGRLDEVDALGYLDAIEKVGRETRVVVFVYDNECEVSATIEEALQPLVRSNTTVHFVKVHFEDIEFDPAAVPSLLAYHNQGDLFANLTGIIEMMPDDETFGSAQLKRILEKHKVL